MLVFLSLLLPLQRYRKDSLNWLMEEKVVHPRVNEKY